MERGRIRIFLGQLVVAADVSGVSPRIGAMQLMLSSIHGLEYLVSALPRQEMVHALRDGPMLSLAALFQLPRRRVG